MRALPPSLLPVSPLVVAASGTTFLLVIQTGLASRPSSRGHRHAGERQRRRGHLLQLLSQRLRHTCTAPPRRCASSVPTPSRIPPSRAPPPATDRYAATAVLRVDLRLATLSPVLHHPPSAPGPIH
ncbi:hypothetical protein B0H11DRAFT_2251761 [Mycena galericulata]|nr:hypothetical protein B0H11DRAFT_2251761 [Mycena galericulata]